MKKNVVPSIDFSMGGLLKRSPPTASESSHVCLTSMEDYGHGYIWETHFFEVFGILQIWVWWG